MTNLTFQSTKFDIVDQGGKPWLRLPQIGAALGYANHYKVQKVFDRHSDEFTDKMTAVVDLDTAGGKQKVRIFSLRGAHLLGMLARTSRAKEFREWVLDVLEGIADPQDKPKLKPTTKALPGCLTTDQQDAIKEMVRARVEALPHEKQKGAAIRCWSSLKSKFGVTYKEIPSEHYPEAVSLLARLPLDGEVIEKQPDQDIIQQAFGFGATVAGEVVKSMVSAMIEGSTDLSLDRWMVSLDSDGRPYARAIDRQAIVCSIPKLAKEIGAPCGIMATDKELLELAMACNHALSIRLRGRGAQAQ